jgi:hypothetical protein
VKIEKEGYKPWVLEEIKIDKDINLGEIPLLKERKK